MAVHQIYTFVTTERRSENAWNIFNWTTTKTIVNQLSFSDPTLKAVKSGWQTAINCNAKCYESLPENMWRKPLVPKDPNFDW